MIMHILLSYFSLFMSIMSLFTFVTVSSNFFFLTGTWSNKLEQTVVKKHYIMQRRILNFQSQQRRTMKITPFITIGPTGIKATCPVSDGLINPVNVMIFIPNKVSYLESAN